MNEPPHHQVCLIVMYVVAGCYVPQVGLFLMNKPRGASLLRQFLFSSGGGGYNITPAI